MVAYASCIALSGQRRARSPSAWLDQNSFGRRYAVAFTRRLWRLRVFSTGRQEEWFLWWQVSRWDFFLLLAVFKGTSLGLTCQFGNQSKGEESGKACPTPMQELFSSLHTSKRTYVSHVMFTSVQLLDAEEENPRHLFFSICTLWCYYLSRSITYA